MMREAALSLQSVSCVLCKRKETERDRGKGLGSEFFIKMMRYRKVTGDAASDLYDPVAATGWSVLMIGEGTDSMECVRCLRAVKAVLIDRVGDSMLCYVSYDWGGHLINAMS
jgi:hypothetical protein